MVATPVAASKLAPAAAQEQQLRDVHTDPRWAGIKWTIYRGVAYDITAFIPRHPGGEWLVNLAVGRDCTALFESYHLRHDVALQAFNKLPQLEGFPVDAVPRAPYPADSKLYSGKGHGTVLPI
jgi:fatty acid desaturase (delta-4 desaturase)